MIKHAAVLMGGWSAEREVSLVSGAAVAAALTERGFRTTTIDVDRDLAGVLREIEPDIVFNALHGRFGEDGTVQGLLEILGLPYTHSGVLASALAMHKPTAKRLFRDVGIPTPEGRILSRKQMQVGAMLQKPFVVKPINEGSSVDVRIVLDRDNFDPMSDSDWPYGDQVLVEAYIPGREITAAVMGDEALGATELRPSGRFYDYKAKYSEGQTEHLVPAPLPPAVYDEVCRLAVVAHRTLGCRGVTRSDFRYDDTAGDPGKIYLLEVNTQPGMTPLSLVPEIAAYRGMSFADLVMWITEDAGCDR